MRVLHGACMYLNESVSSKFHSMVSLTEANAILIAIT